MRIGMRKRRARALLGRLLRAVLAAGTARAARRELDVDGFLQPHGRLFVLPAGQTGTNVHDPYVMIVTKSRWGC